MVTVKMQVQFSRPDAVSKHSIAAKRTCLSKKYVKDRN